jgi:hypothetical protein
MGHHERNELHEMGSGPTEHTDYTEESGGILPANRRGCSRIQDLGRPGKWHRIFTTKNTNYTKGGSGPAEQSGGSFAREWARMGANSGRRKAGKMTSDFYHEKHEIHERGVGPRNTRNTRKNQGECRPRMGADGREFGGNTRPIYRTKPSRPCSLRRTCCARSGREAN